MSVLEAESVVVPGYRVIRPLGVGGMASVYLAMQESLSREVALKVMAPSLAANKEFTDRFLREGRITAQLSHPNLVTIFDIGSHGTIYYIAAEFVPGGTMRERVQEGMSVAAVLDTVRDVALGLHYAHEKGFVHRDVKPGNILYRSNGAAVLADFGIAKSVDSKTMATQAGASIGTPHYMSPEQARGELVDGRCDLYSLGVVLYEALTGKTPYEAPDPFSVALMHITQPVPRLPDPYGWMQPLIDGLMAKLPEDRYQDGEDFVADCERLLASAPEGITLREQRDTKKRQVVSRLTPLPRSRVEAGATGPTPQPGAAKKPAAAPSASAESAARPKLALYGGVGAVVLLAIVVGGWFAFRTPAGLPASPLPPTVTTAPETPSQPFQPAQPPLGHATPPETSPGEVPTTVIGAEAATEKDIPSLLAKANEYLKEGITSTPVGHRLNSPSGDCALDLYRTVMRLDPDNADAKAGLSQISMFYQSKARALLERHMARGAVVLAEEGLKAEPENGALQGLLKQAEQEAGQ